jgi:hypothetical protein
MKKLFHDKTSSCFARFFSSLIQKQDEQIFQAWMDCQHIPGQA